MDVVGPSIKNPIGASTSRYHDGLTTTTWSNEAAAIKGNRGIDQWTGRRGRIKINGCSRKEASSGGQLFNEEPKQGWLTSIFRAISRSSMIGGDHRRWGTTIAQFFTHILKLLLAELYIYIEFTLQWGLCWIIITFIPTFFAFIRCTRGENRLSRVYPASLMREFIYLPSTHLETHLRTEHTFVEAYRESAKSSRTNLPISTSKDQKSNFSFTGPNHSPSQESLFYFVGRTIIDQRQSSVIKATIGKIQRNSTTTWLTEAAPVILARPKNKKAWKSYYIYHYCCFEEQQ